MEAGPYVIRTALCIDAINNNELLIFNAVIFCKLWMIALIQMLAVILDRDTKTMNILKITKTNRNWHEIILWWEIRRIPYNIILYFVGLLSFYISYVTIPLVYLVIGFALNVIYTLGWIFELLFITRLQDESRKANYPRYTFISYLALSTLFVFGIAILLLIR